MKYLKYFESKKVGIIYHYTNFNTLLKILTSNKLKSFRIINTGPSMPKSENGLHYIKPIEQNSISFTRDSRFHKIDRNIQVENLDCRIVINGDLLSDKYKIQPYSMLPVSRASWSESEEVVLAKEINNIKKYILKIDFIKKPNILIKSYLKLNKIKSDEIS